MAKLVIDCDPGHDDAVAILLAAAHHELLAVTTVHGNAALEHTTRNALKLLTLARLAVPVAAGCAEPLVGTSVHAADIHGASGLDGAELPEPDRAAVPEHAVDVLIDLARAHRGELTVAIVGPCTNVATALKREPRLKEWVKAFTVMGGSTTHGNITPAAEFNIWCDPEAAATVFASGVPIHMVGLNVTRQVGITAEDVATLQGSTGRTARAIGDLMAFYLARQSEIFGLSVAPMHDACAIVPYVAPGLITYQPVHVAVELASPLTRGMTVCDLRRRTKAGGQTIAPAQPPNAQVAIAADARAIIARVVEAVRGYP
jgi:inosine-uridine nucleoside N-ribohydrolase